MVGGLARGLVSGSEWVGGRKSCVFFEMGFVVCHVIFF